MQAQLEASNARALSVPSQMAGAQQNLLLALDLRAEALQTIANDVPSALGTDSAATAIDQIAAEMQALLASDVIYAERVVPADHADPRRPAHHRPDGRLQPLPSRPRLAEPADRDPADARQLRRHDGDRCAQAGNPRPRAALRGRQRDRCSTAAAHVNAIKLTPAPSFTLDVANQGANDETGVVVELKIEGAAGTAPLITSKTINTKSMTDVKVTMGLTGTPPVGETVRLVAEVEPVPGEVDKTNNTQTYLANFSN